MVLPWARLARAVAAGLPHHVTQRGNRRQQTFFGDDDYAAYRDLVRVRPLLERAPNWRALLDSAIDQSDHEAIRRGERTGRPLGAEDFVRRLEETLGRPLAPRKPGRKPKPEE